MNVVLSTANLPEGDRFDYWRDMLAQQAMPVAVRGRPVADFTATMHAADFGTLRTVVTENTSVEVHRTPGLIRRGDPVTFYLIASYQGRQQMGQNRRTAVLEPGDLVLLHSSRASRSYADPRWSRQVGAVAVFDVDALPIPASRLDDLLAVRLPADNGVVSLVASHLHSLGTGRFHPDDGARLSAVTLDLLAVLFARRLDLGARLPGQVRDSALLARVQSFALARLGDPTLTPEALATANHISLRTLQRLFAASDSTVAGWIRGRRLERCRRDLLDPSMVGRPVMSIAARWGFTNAAHFTRVFKAAYGSSPGEFRRQHVDAPGRRAA